MVFGIRGDKRNEDAWSYWERVSPLGIAIGVSGVKQAKRVEKKLERLGFRPVGDKGSIVRWMKNFDEPDIVYFSEGNSFRASSPTVFERMDWREQVVFSYDSFISLCRELGV